MKTLFAYFIGTVLFAGFIGLCIWVCLHPGVFFLLIAAAWVLGSALAGLAAMFSSPPSPNPSTPPAGPPAPVRQPDTSTPLLLGFIIGWWLGGGPGDGSDGC